MALSRILTIAIVALLLVAVGILSLYLYISSITSSLTKVPVNKTAQTISGPIHGIAYVNSTGFSSAGILSYDNAAQVVEYAIVHYDFSNVTSGRIQLTMYLQNPVSRIYLVNVGNGCYQCLESNYAFDPIFENLIYSNLTNYLNEYGLLYNSTSLNYVNLTSGGINITSISQIPHNSIIIIPSGLIPYVLMPVNKSSFSVLNLLNRGDTVIYIGDNFSRAEENGAILLSNSNPSYATSLQNLINGGLQTLPRARNQIPINGLYFSTPTFSFLNGSTFGPLAYIHLRNGTLIAFSNTPFAWTNTSDIVQDIAVALHSRFWLTTVTQSPYVYINGTGSSTIFTTAIPLAYNNQTNNIINSSYSIADVQLLNKTNHLFIQSIPFRVRFENNGTLGFPSQIGEGQPTYITMHIGNVTQKYKNTPVQNNTILFAISIYNSTLSPEFTPIPAGKLNPKTSVEIPYTFTTLHPGYYIGSLQDFNGRIYENALFYIPPLNLSVINFNFRNGTFLIYVKNNGEPVSGIQFYANLNNVYNQIGVINNGVLNYTLPKGSIIKYGPQKINLGLLGVNYSVSTYYQSPAPIQIPPFYIEFSIAAIAIIILNLVLRAPTRDEYFIDVPLFPPTEKIEVKANPDSILSIFDTVNNRFGWKHMPLTAEEMKSGISSSIRYKNLPIMITMENASEVLYSMANTGQVDVIAPYFMPKRWNQEAHHDIEYLVIFRKLRDFAIKNATLFTDIDSAGAADMILTTRGTQSFVYIYSHASGVREIKIGNTLRTFIVFLDAESRAQFLDKLYNTYGDQAEKLRLSIASGVINLIDTENLEQLLY